MQTKLYRDLNEIFHPSISRENISNYKILLKNNLLPIKVFYPKKEVNLDRLIILISTDESICSDLAINTESVVFLLDYSKNDYVLKCYKFIKYIYKEIDNYDIDKKNVCFMSYESSSNILEKVLKNMDDIDINKLIFLNPSNEIVMGNNKLILSCNLSIDRKQVYEIIKDFILQA